MGGQVSVPDGVHVVVVGGGFGGIAAAQQLKCAGISFTLVDLRDAFHHNVAALRASVQPGTVCSWGFIYLCFAFPLTSDPVSCRQALHRGPSSHTLRRLEPALFRAEWSEWTRRGRWWFCRVGGKSSTPTSSCVLGQMGLSPGTKNHPASQCFLGSDSPPGPQLVSVSHPVFLSCWLVPLQNFAVP
ncbi:hypothetical protein XENOCAPTIV_008996 [Xenoophorus captivus]|uniref:FAD/NAD(P)-binding domain-containing protein n=1 Tax=Xenoophorus captivus TaxID=1517983 RepID=A0ABV0Q9S3_9TELE